MSIVTDVILVTAICDGAMGKDDSHPSVDQLNRWLAGSTGRSFNQLVRVDQHAGGSKAMQCDVWMAGINMLDEDALVEAFLAIDWQDPDSAQLMLKSEQADRFRVYRADRGRAEELTRLEALAALYLETLDPKIEHINGLSARELAEDSIRAFLKWLNARKPNLEGDR